MNLELLLFYIIGGIAIASAVLVVTRKHALYSALFMIVNMCSLAVLYLMLQAQFIAIIQILVYAGAIMVLFLFVIMLLNLGEENSPKPKILSMKTFGYALCVVLLAQFVFAFSKITSDTTQLSPNAAHMGTVEYIGKVLFTEYLFPFEAVSFLLLAAIIGAVVLAKKKFQ
ncbi:MAG: NADH-quinone oxidoreductase subunit J [Ignavibacteriales bacterium]|nr:NADH-quinone oxidoreductase subunit J [Ignavibacteriales bacterium]